MAGINQLQSIKIQGIANQNKNSTAKEIEPKEHVKDFGQTIKDFIQAVNDNQIKADNEASDIIQGKSDNLHQAMASMEEARLSFQLMIEIRNKMLESYQRIERMQV
jgi:flagellar hook-basal body complex protein FliE